MNKITRFIKSLLISENSTFSPKEIEITPGGTSGTKTSIVSSQTVDRTVTIPDDTTTLLGTATTQNVSNKTITSSTLDSSPVGATTPSTGAFTSLQANTVNLDGGTIDNTAIGSVIPSTGDFTDLTATSAEVNGDPVVTEVAVQTLKNKSLEDTTTAITDFADPTIRLKFDAAGTTATSTTLLGSQTANRILTLPDATDTLVGRNTVDTLTNKTLTGSSLSGATITGGSINNTPIGQTTPAAADFTTVDTTGDLNVGGNTVITGNLTVNGTTTTLNTQTLDVEDTNITINKGGNDASSEGAGLTVDRTGADGSFIYRDTSATKWAAGALGSEVDLVGTTSTQTLTNKSLVDNSTSITSSVVPTNKIVFSALGLGTNVTTTIAKNPLGSSSTNHVLPLVSGVLVQEDTSQTLSNKTLQFLRQSVATNAALTGTDQTLNTITTGIVRLTNSSLTSLAGISAGASGQSITVENKTGNTLSLANESSSATAADRVLTGTGGTVSMLPDATFVFTYDSTSARWQLTGGSGSGTGSGGVNFIPNGNAESTNPFIGYVYTAGTRPIASTGGLGTSFINTSITTTNPLADNSSFLITKTNATNQQGVAQDIPFTASLAYKAKACTIEFDYILSSGTFQAGTSTQDSDLIVYIIDVDNNVAIQPSNFKLLSNSTTIASKFQAQFQTSSNSTNYRLSFYSATNNTNTYTLKVDNIKVGPSQYVYGTPVTDWQSWTPTGTWTTNTTYTGRKRRVGDQMEYDITVSLSGAPNVAILDVNLQETIDTTKLSMSAGGRYEFGMSTCVDTGVQTYHGLVAHQTNTSVRPQVYQTNATFANINSIIQNTPMIFGAGDYVTLRFAVPIVGLSSSVQMSDNADTRVVSTRAFRATSNQVVSSTALTQVIYNSTSFDSHGTFNTSTGAYVVPVSGRYKVYSSLYLTGAAVEPFTHSIYKNGVSVTERFFTGAPDVMNVVSDTLDCITGDIITINIQSTADTSYSIVFNSKNTFLDIERISGPSTIAATETIAARVSKSVNQTLTNGVITKITFDTEHFDTHGFFSGSTFTAGISGIYDISGHLFWAQNGTAGASMRVMVYINGAQISTVWETHDSTANVEKSTIFSTLYRLRAGDTIEIYGFQNGAATLVVHGDSTLVGGTVLNIKKIGL